jgi:hypothetical protein
MKRRRFLQALAVTPAVPVLAPRVQAQQPAEPPPAAPPLTYTAPDAAADVTSRFFDARQFRTLRKLGDLLSPSLSGSPNATDARAPEFLDFLIGESSRDRQQLYLTGLDTLEYNAQVRWGKAFADLDASQADEILKPMAQPWSYVPPDPLTGFLWSAREDVRNATRNSVEWAQSGRFGAGGSYWKLVE